jgi:hypothetical protein
MDIRRVYSIMIEICKQRRARCARRCRPMSRVWHTDVQSFILLHLLVKIGGATNDAATSLKLLEKGLSKEDLALAVLIDFPFQMFGGWAAAKWSSGKRPLNPVRTDYTGCKDRSPVSAQWITATWIRLGFCVIAMLLVGCFPSTQPIPRSYFFLVIACTVLSSFAWFATSFSPGWHQLSPVQHDPIRRHLCFPHADRGPRHWWHLYDGAPHYARVTWGAAYLRGTAAEYGLKPRRHLAEILCPPGRRHLYDRLLSNPNSRKRQLRPGCAAPSRRFPDSCPDRRTGSECVTDAGKLACTELHGTCTTVRDGYFPVSSLCIAIGACLLYFVCMPTARRLQGTTPHALSPD